MNCKGELVKGFWDMNMETHKLIAKIDSILLSKTDLDSKRMWNSEAAEYCYFKLSNEGNS